MHFLLWPFQKALKPHYFSTSPGCPCLFISVRSLKVSRGWLDSRRGAHSIPLAASCLNLLADLRTQEPGSPVPMLLPGSPPQLPQPYFCSRLIIQTHHSILHAFIESLLGTLLHGRYYSSVLKWECCFILKDILSERTSSMYIK